MERGICASCLHFTADDDGKLGCCSRYPKALRKHGESSACGEYGPRRGLSEKAAGELRSVARFLDKNAEALVGDMDSTYVLDTGLRFEFSIMERGSIATVRVAKEHYAMSKMQA